MPIETPSDRDFACFICCEFSSKSVLDRCPTCNIPLDAGRFLSGSVDSYDIISYVGRGFYGATFKASNRIGKIVALKLVPTLLYEKQGKSFNSELERYRRLDRHPNIAELLDAGKDTIEIFQRSVPVFFTAMEWVDGWTLDEFIVDNQDKLTASIIYNAVMDIGSAIAHMEHKNIWHNDLNASNILVRRITPEEAGTRRSAGPYELKLIDTGSAVFREASTRRRVDDIAHLAHHIDRLKLALDRGSTTPGDLYFIDRLATIAGMLLDENNSRRLNRANEAITAVSNAFNLRHFVTSKRGVALNSPYEYLNANDFPDDQFVFALFSAKFPWVRNILAAVAQPMLIAGPRGSGKTMLLRSMRSQPQLVPVVNDAPDPAPVKGGMQPYIAFFVSARIEIGNHLLETKLPAWALDSAAIVAYFNLLYTFEVLRTLLAAKSIDRVRIEPVDESALCLTVSADLDDACTTLERLIESVQTLQLGILRGTKIGVLPALLSEPGYLGRLCATLKIHCGAWRNHTIIFLLDDFSVPKIPSSIQALLLPIIWNSGSGYVFKVSSHSQSMLTVDSRSNRYTANRDFMEINLGAQYINSVTDERGRSEVEKCLDEIFQLRYDLSSRAFSSARMLLGDSVISDIAEEIRSRATAKTLRAIRYSGWDVVMQLCSGDISYVIDLVGRMMVGRTNLESAPVPIDVQNTAIRHYARSELISLQECYANYCSLYDVALNFGKMSQFKLLQSNVSQGKVTRPGEYLRIEVDLGPDDRDARLAIAELLRDGVFIDGGFSASSRGAPAMRLIFRKLLTPAFPTTYRNRDTFAMSSRNFLEFLRNPTAKLRGMAGEEGIEPENQQLVLDRLFQPDVE